MATHACMYMAFSFWFWNDCQALLSSVASGKLLCVA